MPKLGQFPLGGQLLGTRILPDNIPKISRCRIPLGAIVRKSLLGASFPKTFVSPPHPGHTRYPHQKEVTYQISRGTQQRKRYQVTFIPTSPDYNSIWEVFRAAVSAWQSLSADAKLLLDRRARKVGPMSGFNLSIRDYFNEHY